MSIRWGAFWYVARDPERQFRGELSRARRAQLAYYQRMNRLLTPFFQGDSRLLGAMRDVLMPLAARLPGLRDLMVATMCGIKQGLLRRSLPVAPPLLALKSE